MNIRSFHLCFIDCPSGFLWPTRWPLDPKTRVRTRMFEGSHFECMYHLMTFGIPTKDFPVTDDGMQMKKQNHRRWIESMKQLEETKGNNERQEEKAAMMVSSVTTRIGRNNNHRIPTPHVDSLSPSKLPSSMLSDGGCRTNDAAHEERQWSQVVILPTRNDILFGRGKPIQEHPGNIRLLVMLESILDRYESLKRKEKSKLPQEVILKVKSMGGRFLRRQDDGTWEEVDDDTAREKVSHTFRSIRSSANKNNGLGNNRIAVSGGTGNKRRTATK